MLDKNEVIEQIDSDNSREEITGQYKQLLHGFNVESEIDASGITRVVVAGMGGSALAARLAQTWWFDQLPVPFEIVRGYDLPAYVDKQTLVVCSSYSGNTEETVSAYDQARKREALMVVAASGGKLVERAESDNVPVYQIPGGCQPRFAAWYGVRALAELFEQLGLVTDAVSELEDAAEFLKTVTDEWQPDVSTGENRAKQIAEECMGKAVWIYSGPALNSAAYKWKIDINENAKHVASWNELPEFNHNEFLGWTEHPREKPFTVIQLQSALDNERIRKRFEVTNRLLSGRMPTPIVIESRGEAHIQHLLWTCLLGDYASFYLAILNNVNPGKVDAIEQLKWELG